MRENISVIRMHFVIMIIKSFSRELYIYISILDELAIIKIQCSSLHKGKVKLLAK
jgi:hypothetical protein